MQAVAAPRSVICIFTQLIFCMCYFKHLLSPYYDVHSFEFCFSCEFWTTGKSGMHLHTTKDIESRKMDSTNEIFGISQFLGIM